MNSISAISLSGMNAAQTSMSASAFNIAHLGFDGFRREQLQQSPDTSAGAPVPGRPALGEDMIADMVGVLVGKTSLLANLAVFKTSAEMTGTLLDTLG